MDDQLIDSLRELAFTRIDLIDAEIRPDVQRLADRLTGLPDIACQAPTRATYLVLILQDIEAKLSDAFKNDFEAFTLDSLKQIIDERLHTGQWPEDI